MRMVASLCTVAVLATCAVWRVALFRKIVRSTGGTWDINFPMKNLREERKAMRSLPPGRLRTEFSVNMILALGSWLVALQVGVTNSYGN